MLLCLQQEGLFASTYSALATFVASDAMENSHITVDVPVILNSLDQATVFVLPLMPSRIAAGKLWTAIAKWITAGRPPIPALRDASVAAGGSPVTAKPPQPPTTLDASLASLTLVRTLSLWIRFVEDTSCIACLSFCTMVPALRSLSH